MAFKAVGNKNVCVTRCCCINENARSAEKRPGQATMGLPKYKLGNKASIKPPVQVQSAGDHMTALLPVGKSPCPIGSTEAGEKPNQFWLHTKPLRLPISAWCGINAPLGGPVVPLV